MDYQAPRVLMERMEDKVHKDHLVNQDRGDYLVMLQLVSQVKMEPQEQPEHLGNQEQLE